jgi:aryl-alcohol dehydrogenase-like predicted oxidoreductase
VRYRKVGTNDLAVSEIAFGCGGNAGLMVRGSPAEQLAIVARALELGVTYFDNSPDYGDGTAETNLGIVLKSLGARPILNTKVEIRSENLNDVAGHVVRSAEDSLRRLGVDHVDVFQIHNGPARVDPKLEGRKYTQLSSELARFDTQASYAAATMAKKCGSCSTRAYSISLTRLTPCSILRRDEPSPRD